VCGGRPIIGCGPSIGLIHRDGVGSAIKKRPQGTWTRRRDEAAGSSRFRSCPRLGKIRSRPGPGSPHHRPPCKRISEGHTSTNTHRHAGPNDRRVVTTTPKSTGVCVYRACVVTIPAPTRCWWKSAPPMTPQSADTNNMHRRVILSTRSRSGPRTYRLVLALSRLAHVSNGLAQQRPGRSKREKRIHRSGARRQWAVEDSRALRGSLQGLGRAETARAERLASARDFAGASPSATPLSDAHQPRGAGTLEIHDEKAQRSGSAT